MPAPAPVRRHRARHRPSWRRQRARQPHQQQRQRARLKALAAGLARFRAAAESLPDGLVILDAQDRIVFFNRRHPEHLPDSLRRSLRLGVRFADWLKEGLAQGPVYHPEMGPDYAERRLAMRARPELEQEHKHADGRWVRIRESRMPKGAGRVLLTTDITARKEAEARLVASEQRFLAAAESIPDGLVIFDADDRIAFYNSRYPSHLPESLRQGLKLGVRFEDWIREGLARGPVYHPDMGEGFAPARLALRRGGRPVEHEHKLPDGRWMRLRESPMPDGSGRVLLTTDVSAPRRQRRALAAQTRKLEAVLANIAEGVSILDQEGRVVLVNDGFLRLYGFPKALAVPGTPLRAFVEHRLGGSGPEAAALVQERVEALLAHQGSAAFEETSPDGTRTILVRRERLLPDGLLVSAYADISELKRRERENALLAAAIEEVGDSVEIAGPDWRLLYVNPAFTRLTGWRREEALGRTPAELMRSSHAHGQDEAFFAAIEAALAAGRTWQGRLASRHRAGHLLLQDATISPVRDPASGALTHVVAVKRDVSERIRAEEALRASEARLAAFMEHAPVGMYLKDLEGRYLLLNPEMGRFLGRPASSMLGRGPEAALPPAEVARIRAADAEVLATGGPTRHEEDHPGAPAGVPAWSMVIRFPVRDPQGRIVQIGGFDVDITRQKAAQAELAASEQRFRAIAESHPTPMMVARLADRKAMFANAAFLATFRLSAEELATLDRDRLYVDPAQRRAMLAAVEAEGQAEHREIMLRRADDGEPFPAFLIARAIRYQGEACAVVSFQDLSALKAAEALIARQREALHQSEKLTALGSLLAGVAHELNNPLSVVTGYAEMLRDLAPDPATRARAERVHAAAERCARIVKTFLAMARQRPPQRGPVDLARTVEAALDLAGYGLRSTGVAVSLEGLAPALLPPVWGDADQLHQVLVNLIVNAQQALGQVDPPRRLAVRAWAQADEVRLEIADNGPGMAPEVRKRIFEPFFTTKPQGAGTGIGLSVCHGILSAHGGRIEVESAPGRGTLVRLALPRAREEAETVAAGGRPPSPPPLAAAGGRTALVVDDEGEIAELVAQTLAGLGLKVETAASGREALARLAMGGIDLVVSDLRMPDLDGPALVAAIRARHPALAARLILITGDALGGAGGDGLPVLEKPLDLAALRREAWRLLLTAEGEEPGR